VGARDWTLFAGGSFLHRSRRGLSQQGEASNCLPAFFRCELIENSSNSRGIEYRLLGFDPDSGFRQTKPHASAVPGIALSNDIAAARQAVNHQGHGGRSDTHVRRQRQQSGRFNFVQMVEYAGLVRAEYPVALGIGHMPRVARKVDAWVERHQLGGLIGQ
jgi:hypothetical protein